MISSTFPPAPRRSALCAAVLAALALTGCSSADAPVAPAVQRPAYVVEVGQAAHRELGFVGEVRAQRRAELSFPVAGRVEAVHVDVGSDVRAGQVLATLDLRPLRAQLAAARGGLAQAEAQLAEARSHHERVRAATEAGAASSAETTGAQERLAAAVAAHEGAVAQRDLAAWSLEHATLRAPVSGVVGVRMLEPGQATGPGAPVLVVDGEGRELSVLVPAGMAVKSGQAVRLRSGGTELASKVLRVGARLEAGGVRRVYLTAPAEAAVGSTWSVVLANKEAATAMQVPLRAVLPDERPGHGRVLRIAGDGHTVQEVEVKLGEIEGDAIDVVGLERGDRVVIAGASAIKPGSLVQPRAYMRGAR